jgi:hypothetical protein
MSLGMAARVGLLALSFVPSHSSSAADAGTLPRDCEAILAGLRRLKVATNDTLGDVQNHLREAQRLGEWFGMEQFEPYIILLRDQEQKLRTKIDEIRQITCQPMAVAPPEEIPR